MFNKVKGSFFIPSKESTGCSVHFPSLFRLMGKQPRMGLVMVYIGSDELYYAHFHISRCGIVLEKIPTLGQDSNLVPNDCEVERYAPGP